tara:strand:+ start:60 stop:542 length:483 start_codon:yes stop_codon:yes gene_type:complete
MLQERPDFVEKASVLSTRTSGHPHIETILRYYEGCNTADIPLMKSTFTDDVVHYFTDHGAVRGAESLAMYWSKVGPRTEANWVLDHAMVQDEEAVIEWSMRWRTPEGRLELLRGSEWYIFRDGVISEIRSYHSNYFLHDRQNRALWDFDYEGRGYRQEAD